MGFLSKIFNNTVKSALNTNYNSSASGSSSEFFGANPVNTNKTFEQKIYEIIGEAGAYEIEKNISCEVLERELGHQIFERGSCRLPADNISYGIFMGGVNVLYIRFWISYGDYDRSANRDVRKFFDDNNIKVLDFFDYLPNDYEYMKDRILAVL